MQELGVWITNDGATPATLELEAETWDASAQELPAWVTGAAKGALAGAATGAAAGPWGALIGAAAGGAVGAATSAATPTPATAGSATSPATPATAGSATSPATPATAASPAIKPSTSGDAATRAKVAQALQQFAIVVPTLVQLLTTSGAGAKELANGANGAESMDDAWGPEAFVGTWSVP